MTDQPTVLVAEDEPDVLLLCRVILEFDGYAVIEASDGEVALERVHAHNPEVVLLDVMLPKMDGWQILEAIRGDPAIADTPVVIFTANPQDGDQERAWSRGATEYVAKPFSPLSLSRILEDVLATSSDEEARRRQSMLERIRSPQRP